MTSIRKLTAEDRDLIAQALSWVDAMPQWAKDADKAWYSPTVDEYLEMMRDDPQVDIGVFEDGKMIAGICVALAGRDVYNSHLMMKRGANIDAIAIAAMSVKQQLFKVYGAKQIWSWALARNCGLQNILKEIGMSEDGLRQFKGQSHGSPLEWVRYSVSV